MLEVLGAIGSVASIVGLITQAVSDLNGGRKPGSKSEAATFPKLVLPEHRNIIPRPEEFRSLSTQVASSKGAVITSKGAVLHGEGGVGKTTLARHYAERFEKNYAGGAWIAAQSRDTLLRDIYRFGILAFGLPTLERVTEDHALAVVQGIRDLDAKLLFVFDNVEAESEATRFLPIRDNVDLILTTRSTEDVPPGFERLQLGVMKHDAANSEAVELLLQEAENTLPDDATRQAAWALAQAVEGLPLALVIAGALVREGESFASVTSDIEGLVKERPADGGAYRDSIAAAVKLSYDKLSEDAQGVADVCAWFAADGLEPRLFTDAPGGDFWGSFNDDIPKRWWPFLEDTSRVNAAFRELKRRSILKDGETGALIMHRLTAASLRVEQAERAQGYARAAAALVRAVYPAGTRPPQDPATWDMCRRLTPHGTAVWQKAEVLWDEAWGKPDWAPMDSLLNQMSVFYHSQEDRTADLAAARASLRLKEARLGEEDRNLPVALGNLGESLALYGEYAEAEPQLERAVALDRMHRPESDDLGAQLILRAKLEFRRCEAGAKADHPGDLVSAETWISEAKEIFEALGYQSRVALAWNALGYLHRLAEQAEPSADACEQAYRIAKTIPKVSLADLAAYAMNAGSARLEAGQAVAAEGLLKEAYRIRTEIFAQNRGHSDLRNSAQWLVSCLIILGQEAEAREIAAAEGLDWEEMQRVAAQIRRDGA